MSIANLNSFGNFTCSVWNKDGISVGNEEGLNGRSHLILSEIKKKIQEKFTEEEIKKKTIIDIGCYDGFYLTELSKLKFKKIIGLEPKKKNIVKGREIRKFLKIEEPNIEFIEGDLSTLATNNKFDIVLCLGVLHHISDHYEFLKKIINLTSEILFLDSRVIKNTFINKKKVLNKTEMLDVIYKFKKKKISFSVHKYESSFNDTSTNSTGVVSIPSEETIEIFLDSLNFKTTTLVSPENYRKILNHKRDLDGILVYAEPKNVTSKNYSLTYAMLHEKKLFKENFKDNLIENLYTIAHNKYKFIFIFKKNFYIYILLKKKFFLIFDFFFSKKFNQNQIEILKNLHYSFNDKIKYELSKYFYYKNSFKKAFELSSELTNKINADFRSVYRSFYLLYKIAKEMNHDRKTFAKYYLRLFYGKL